MFVFDPKIAGNISNICRAVRHNMFCAYSTISMINITESINVFMPVHLKKNQTIMTIITFGNVRNYSGKVGDDFTHQKIC